MRYSELQATRNFSFLRGDSHPGELVEQACALGYEAIVITDPNSLAWVCSVGLKRWCNRNQLEFTPITNERK